MSGNWDSGNSRNWQRYNNRHDQSSTNYRSKGWGESNKNNYYGRNDNHGNHRDEDNRRYQDQSRWSDNREYSSNNNHSDYRNNSHGDANRQDRQKMNVKSEPTDPSHDQSYPYRKVKGGRSNKDKKRRPYDFNAESKKIKVETEAEQKSIVGGAGGAGGGESSTDQAIVVKAEPTSDITTLVTTTDAIVKHDEPVNAIVKHDEAANAIVKHEGAANAIVKREERSIEVRNENYDPEEERKKWEDHVLSCYKFRPEREYIPEEAFQPDPPPWLIRKHQAALDAIAKVKERMRKDAENNMERDDDDDSYDSEDSYYNISCGRVSVEDNFPYSLKKIQEFFEALTRCTPTTIGFDVSGINPDDDKNCHCPCDKTMTGWRIKYNIDDMIMKKKFCSKGKLTSMGLMAHVRKEGESCVLHFGIQKYLEYLYGKDTLDYRGGVGHKSMYMMGQPLYKAADAAHKKELLNEIKAGKKQIAEEKRRRLKLEADNAEQSEKLKFLERTNKDQLEKLQKLENDRKFFNLKKKDAGPKLDKATVGRYQKSFVAFFNTAKNALRSLEKVNTKPKKEPLVIRVEQKPKDFKIQKFFDNWYGKKKDNRNASLLFCDDLSKASYGKNYYGHRICDEWNVIFGNEAEKGGDDDDAVDEGGPTREFLAKCWKQLGGLKVWREQSDEEIKKDFEANKMLHESSDTEEAYDIFAKKTKAIYLKAGQNLSDEMLKRKWKIDEKLHKSNDEETFAKYVKKMKRVAFESGVKLFETQKNGVVPLADDILRYQIKRIFPADEHPDYITRANSYYTAVGRILLHSLTNNHIISASVMPPLYQNWLLRDCSPKDDDYHNDDVLTHVIDSGGTKDSFKVYVGKEYEFEDGSEVVTKETVFTKLIPEQFLQSRKDALSRIQAGLTLDGDYILCDFLRPFPLEVVQKVAFSPAEITAKDVIAVLKPVYCADWEDTGKGKEEFIQQQKIFYENELCRILKRRESDPSTLKESKKFLSSFVKFCTGFDYLPDPDGQPDFKITIEFNFQETEGGQHPVAHTCVNTLKLPGLLYPKGADDFENKLLEAINYYGENFNMT